MMEREIEKDILSWYKSSSNALLLDGARKIGKTYSIREIAKNNFPSFLEINLKENIKIRNIIKSDLTGHKLLNFMSLNYKEHLIEHQTIIIFDNIESCNNSLQIIENLINSDKYRYIFISNPIELKQKINGLDILHMHPMTLREFCIANGVGEIVFDYLQHAYTTLSPVSTTIHQRMLKLFHLYMLVGGMPSAVDIFLTTNNLWKVKVEQQNIIKLYKKDIEKLDFKEYAYIRDIYNIIPNTLNSKNKRIKLSQLKIGLRYNNIKQSIDCLTTLGFMLPVYGIDGPSIPFKKKSNTFFKPYLNDVGLLTSNYQKDVALKLILQKKDINYGSLYENVIAQELTQKGIEYYYYQDKKIGELDFVTNVGDKHTLINVKSGKTYKRHNAINYFSQLNDSNTTTCVLWNNNVKKENNINYFPIYMIMFL